MKELDLLLTGWLDRQFEGASEAQRAQFEALLALPDPQLAGYLVGGEPPQDPQLAALVKSIRAGTHIMSTSPPGREP
jgi:succinate dehydrogenase flavin-adding protein (antitoxin of CptAB toxin-antitoxin module)